MRLYWLPSTGILRDRGQFGTSPSAQHSYILGCYFWPTEFKHLVPTYQLNIHIYIYIWGVPQMTFWPTEFNNLVATHQLSIHATRTNKGLNGPKPPSYKYIYVLASYWCILSFKYTVHNGGYFQTYMANVKARKTYFHQSQLAWDKFRKNTEWKLKEVI